MRHRLMRWCVIGSLLVAGMAEGRALAGIAQGRAPAPEATGPVLDKTTREEVQQRQEKRRDLLRQALESHLKRYRSSRVELRAVMETSKQLLWLCGTTSAGSGSLDIQICIRRARRLDTLLLIT
jgi:hypothetical protein